MRTTAAEASQRFNAWSDKAVRDTIADIVQQPGYRRELGESAMGKILNWMWDRFQEFLELFDKVPHGRKIALGMGILIVLLIIARIVIGIRAEANAHKFVSRSKVMSGRNVSLDEAERLAGLGEFTAAAHVLFAALLSVGAARGEFRVHPSKTTGDYARDLRRKRAAWSSPFQSFRSRYDRVIYGDMQCTPEDYGALLNDARNMLGRERAA